MAEMPEMVVTVRADTHAVRALFRETARATILRFLDAAEREPYVQDGPMTLTALFARLHLFAATYTEGDA